MRIYSDENWGVFYIFIREFYFIEFTEKNFDYISTQSGWILTEQNKTSTWCQDFHRTGQI